MVGFNRRRLAAAERLRTLLASLDGGSVRIESEFHALPSVWNPVSGVRDPLDDLASHHLDLFRFLTGSEIESVDARRLEWGGIELRAEMGSGVRCSCGVSQGTASREKVTVFVGDQAGRAERPRWGLRPSADRLTPAGGTGRLLLDRGAKLLRRIRGRPDPMSRSFAMQLEVFVACALGVTSPSPGVEDGVAVVRAVEAARACLDD
jgi:predicted dehydrogenase